MTANMSNDLPAKAEPFIRRIEEIDEELESIKGAYMAQCRTLRGSRKEMFGEAKDEGLQVKPLKAVVKLRSLKRKIAALPSDFDVDEGSQFEALAEAFGDTPFGNFAAARASAGRGRRRAKGDALDELAH